MELQMPNDVAERFYRKAVNAADAHGITLRAAIDKLDLSQLEWCDLRIYIEAEYDVKV